MLIVKVNFFVFKVVLGVFIIQIIILDFDKVCRELQIYQFKFDDKLFDYYKVINEVAFDIVLKNLILLCFKLEL